MQVIDLVTLLALVASPAGAAAVASLILERLAWFQRQETQYKVLINASVCAGLALAAWAVGTYVNPSVIKDLNVPSGVVITAFAFVVNQATHAADKQ